MVGDAERLARARQLTDAVPAELVAPVGAQIDQFWNEHLAHLPERARDKSHMALRVGGVGRHGQPGPDHLIVRVGMHEHHPSRRQLDEVRPRPGRHSGSSHTHDPTGRGGRDGSGAHQPRSARMNGDHPRSEARPARLPHAHDDSHRTLVEVTPGGGNGASPAPPRSARPCASAPDRA